MITKTTSDNPAQSVNEAARDGCKFCLGAKGGVPGNENVIGGEVVCDYCTALLMKIKDAEKTNPTTSLFSQPASPLASQVGGSIDEPKLRELISLHMLAPFDPRTWGAIVTEIFRLSHTAALPLDGEDLRAQWKSIDAELVGSGYPKAMHTAAFDDGFNVATNAHTSTPPPTLPPARKGTT